MKICVFKIPTSAFLGGIYHVTLLSFIILTVFFLFVKHVIQSCYYY